MHGQLKTHASILAVIALSIGLMACGGAGDSGTPGAQASTTPDRLDGTTWGLITVDGQPAPDGVTATLDLASGMASGSSGCNTYSGPYTVDGPSLAIGPFASTERACAEPAMSFEQAYLAALAGVTTWAVPQDIPIGRQLTLTGSGPILVFGPPAGS